MDRTISRMSDQHPVKAVIIGAGNVATHLAKALSPHLTVAQIYNRSIEAARELASSTGSEPIDDLSAIIDDADIYIISIKDDAIKPLSTRLGHRKGLWVHTSGSVGMDVLKTVSDTYGVLYPMQTFTKETPVKINEVPIFTEGNDDATRLRIEKIARLISPHVYQATSQLRAQLHIAAVFACNFTNYLWAHCSELLNSAGLSLDIMRPLIEATLDKAMTAGPYTGQTGPARRNDTAVIDRHLSMLDGEAKEIYASMSKYIIDKYNHNNEQNKL